MQVTHSRLLEWIYCLNCHAKDLFACSRITGDEAVRERFFEQRSDLYRLKDKVLNRMINEGLAIATQPFTLWKHRFVMVKLNNRNTYHLPLETNFPTVMNTCGKESLHCWHPGKEKREAFTKYSLEEVVMGLTAYINGEYEVIEDKKPPKKKKAPKAKPSSVIRGCANCAKKKKRKKGKKKIQPPLDKRSMLYIPPTESFDPGETDILLQSIALIGERTIRRYLKNEQPHHQRLLCIGKAVRIMRALEAEGGVCQARRGDYRVGELVFDFLLYDDLPFGRILISVATPVTADDFDDGYCIAELGNNQYYGGLGKKAATSYIYAASGYYEGKGI